MVGGWGLAGGSDALALINQCCRGFDPGPICWLRADLTLSRICSLAKTVD